MRLWHISDTHDNHESLTIPENIDIVIHSGDISNYRDVFRNALEAAKFLEWYKSLNIEYKCLCAGNHDSSIEKRLITPGDISSMGIIYLENSETTIEGVRIWGSPFTPTFGDWSFMKARDKISRIWEEIPEGIDIVVTHGPPKGTLDLSYDREGKLEFCGDGALGKKIVKIQPKLHLFGHLHDMEGVKNAGYLKYPNSRTIYSNGSVVTDGKFNQGTTSNGNIFEI